MSFTPDPRGKRRSHPQALPADWVPLPPGVRPAASGQPAADDIRWWRLQPGDDGVPATVHGGSCVDWPSGLVPPDWSFLSRAEARRVLAEDGAVTCPKCRPAVGL